MAEPKHKKQDDNPMTPPFEVCLGADILTLLAKTGGSLGVVGYGGWRINFTLILDGVSAQESKEES